jgi:hypothetical protein
MSHGKRVEDPIAEFEAGQSRELKGEHDKIIAEMEEEEAEEKQRGRLLAEQRSNMSKEK